uniref:Fibronectin type-II domain-containing protein n=1 Tax=Alexandrium monilatum TaxID=311494 RepID=A0A7S4QBX4_9DINO|mmetsp:Transcript_3897/g.11727  ORF Transcript_3897/g.11727 Transcript_3897/m.11727 type:complete len:147 (-) Transcript_3897:121-561(-)
MARLGRFAVAHVFISLCAGQLGMGPEDLQPLTEFRQQHRKTIDGRLCAAAFVQDRKAYTGCALARNPVGESGRPWCYVEPQLLVSGKADGSWGYCAPAIDYDAVRGVAAESLAAAVATVRGHVAQLQKAQRAAEDTLDTYRRVCSS